MGLLKEPMLATSEMDDGDLQPYRQLFNEWDLVGRPKYDF